jgi:4-aminobutyrate aminotransferase-like enzyme
MWGFQRHGLVPDLVTLGKPMGNGHPLAGLTVRPEILARFGRNASYFNTFGGNPVSAAVGLAVLQVIEEEGLQENARHVGAQLKEGLRGWPRGMPAWGRCGARDCFSGSTCWMRKGQPTAPVRGASSTCCGTSTC